MSENKPKTLDQTNNSDNGTKPLSESTNIGVGKADYGNQGRSYEVSNTLPPPPPKDKQDKK